MAYYHAQATPAPRSRSESDELLGSILKERVAPSLAALMKLDTLTYRAVLDEWEPAYLLAIKALAEENAGPRRRGSSVAANRSRCFEGSTIYMLRRLIAWMARWWRARILRRSSALKVLKRARGEEEKEPGK
jgi:hypothetical protein